MTWPPVFDGVGALVVDSSATDPAVLVEKIRRYTPGLSWIAPKVNGTDTGTEADIDHAMRVWDGLGLIVGVWIYNNGPPAVDVLDVWDVWTGAAFVIYDVESPYKSDEGGHYEWAQGLVYEHQRNLPTLQAAVTSYGGYKASIDFRAFADAGWPIYAQAYDSFTIVDALSYTELEGGPYPASGVHTLVRSLKLVQGQAVYRPESIDG